jgi:hypothetical protein
MTAAGIRASDAAATRKKSGRPGRFFRARLTSTREVDAASENCH